MILQILRFSHLPEMVHEGVKHPCKQCDKEFSQQGKLAKHRREVHEGVTHPCSQCIKEFAQQGNLARHTEDQLMRK